MRTVYWRPCCTSRLIVANVFSCFSFFPSLWFNHECIDLKVCSLTAVFFFLFFLKPWSPVRIEKQGQRFQCVGCEERLWKARGVWNLPAERGVKDEWETKRVFLKCVCVIMCVVIVCTVFFVFKGAFLIFYPSVSSLPLFSFFSLRPLSSRSSGQMEQQLLEAL